MAKWRMLLRLELRFVFGSRLLPWFPVLYAVWFAGSLTGMAMDVSQDIYLYAYEFHMLQHTLSLGLAMLLGILLVRRDVRRAGFEWTASLPASSALQVAAKFAAGLVYMNLFTAAMALVYVCIAVYYADMPMEVALQEAAFFSLQYVTSYAVTLALGMTLALWIWSRMCYLIAFCAWMFGTFFIDIFVITSGNFYFLKTFHLSQFMLDSPLENPVWGPYLFAEEMALSRWFVLCFTGLLLLIGVWLLKRERPSGTIRLWLGAVVAGLIICIGAYLPYGQLWKERYAALETSREAGQYTGDGESWSGEKESFRVNGIDVAMQVRQDNRLEMKATLQLLKKEREDSGEWPFRLHSAFRLRSVTVQGKAVNWSRQGERVIVEVPQEATADRSGAGSQDEALNVEFLYEGKRFDWEPIGSAREAVTAFVHGSSMYLPAEAAWYPLPGWRYDEDEGAADWRSLDAAGDSQALGEADPDFTVTIAGFPGTVYSTLERQSGASGESQVFRGKAGEVHLFAGQLTEVGIEGLQTKIVTNPSNYLEARRFLQAYKQVIEYYDSWLELPMPGVEQIFYFPLRQVSERGDHIQWLVSRSYLISQSKNHNLDAFQLAQVASSALFGDRAAGRGFPSEPLSETSYVWDIRELFYRLYDAENPRGGQSGGSEAESGPRFPGTTLVKEKDEIGRDVEQAFKAGDYARVKRVLNEFYRRGLTVYQAGNYHIYPVISLSEWKEVWNGGKEEDGSGKR